MAVADSGGEAAPRRGRRRARSRRRPPFVEDLLSLGRRRGLSGGLMLLAALLLFISLLLPWSHQFSAATLARYRSTAALVGIPHDPDAWQAYSAVDVLLALLCGALVWVAVRGRALARGLLLAALALALAFCAHASSVPPTNGAALWDAAAHRYVDTGVTAGSGPTLALVALGLGTAGVLLSLGGSVRPAR